MATLRPRVDRSSSSSKSTSLDSTNFFLNPTTANNNDNVVLKKSSGHVPTSYLYHRNIILKVALITRIFIWIYAFAVAQFISSFDSSAELNSVPPTSTSSFNNRIEDQQQYLQSHNNTLIERTIKRVFVKWDSLYYTRIAEFGYEFEQYHAFFPLFPLSLRYLANVLSFITQNYLSYSDYIILSGFLISNISFIVSAIQLLKLGNIIFNNSKISFIATLLYCLNPANIFMAAVYTESTFNLFVFSGLYYLYGGRYYLNSHRQLGLDPIPTRRFALCSSIGALLFSCATATRSNGILLCGFIIYYHNAPLLTSIFRRFFIIVNSITQKRRSSPVLTHSNSFGKLANPSFDFFDFIFRLLLAGAQCIVIILPYIIFQYYGYQRFCLGVTTGQNVESDKFGQWPREWCQVKGGPLSLPNLYGFVQNYYWNQGFFNYYTLQQIPNFVLAAPMIMLSALSVLSYFWYYSKYPYEMSTVTAKLRLKNKINTADRSPYNAHMVPFVVHLGVLTLFSVTFMHVQVITRFFTHSPLVFWFAAKPFLASLESSSGGKSIQIQKYLIILYFLLYNILGCILFPNFYPWT